MQKVYDLSRLDMEQPLNQIDEFTVADRMLSIDDYVDCDAGFPPLLLDPVDFKALYMCERERTAASTNA